METWQSRNTLLAGLPAEEFKRLQPHLTRISLTKAQVLYERGERIEQVYFLEQGVASLLTAVGPGEVGVEAGMIGREGLVGFPASLDEKPVSFGRTLLQGSGSALRMPAAALQNCIQHMPGLRRRCHRYVQAILTQISQMVACNTQHKLAGRLARRLLMSHDRNDGDQLALTQEFLSAMLGVRRSGVTLAVQALEQAGLVRNARGRVTVSNRAGLEQVSCECYRLIRDEYDRLLA